jgi:hypothetical protein
MERIGGGVRIGNRGSYTCYTATSTILSKRVYAVRVTLLHLCVCYSFSDTKSLLKIYVKYGINTSERDVQWFSSTSFFPLHPPLKALGYLEDQYPVRHCCYKPMLGSKTYIVREHGVSRPIN